MSTTPEGVLKHNALGYIKRLIGQAIVEGASEEAIDAYIAGMGVKDFQKYRLQVMGQSKLPKLGEGELLKLGGVATFRALFGLAPATNDVAPVVERPPLEPMSLADAHAVYRKWLGEHYDLAPFDAMLATLAAERLDGDLTWLLVVGAPADGKTETVQSAAGAGAIVTSTIDSKGALLSGTSKKEQSKDATGGLLRKVGERGVIVIKDFTSLLEMNRDARAEVFSALREVYDGRWERNVGVEGGKTLTWTGRIVIIGAVTTAWDKAREALASMGERFVIIRMDSTKLRLEKGRQALGNIGQEVAMRTDLQEVVGRVIAGINTEAVSLTDDERERLLHVANLVTRCRTAVEYDYQGKPIDALQPEAPTRLVKQLAQVLRGACAIGINRDEAMYLAIRCGRDSVPPLRLEILGAVADLKRASLKDVRVALGKPKTTVDRQLQSLHLLGLLTQEEADTVVGREPNGDEIVRKVWFYALSEGVDPGLVTRFPDMSVYGVSGVNREARANTAPVQGDTNTSGNGRRSDDDIPF